MRLLKARPFWSVYITVLCRLPLPFWRKDGILLCCCPSVCRSVSLYVGRSVRQQFRSCFCAEVALTEIKFSIQIYYDNVYVNFDFGYYRAVYERVFLLRLRNLPIICSFRSFLRRGVQGRVYKCFTNKYCWTRVFIQSLTIKRLR